MLGYAQLLHANSVGELVKHGESFARRLLAMARAPGTSPERVDALKVKATILRRMLGAARTVPNEWGAHVIYAGAYNVGVWRSLDDGATWTNIHPCAVDPLVTDNTSPFFGTCGAAADRSAIQAGAVIW